LTPVARLPICGRVTGIRRIGANRCMGGHRRGQDAQERVLATPGGSYMRVIVVGSGVVGASCAYTASCLGAEVLLADAAMPGQATAAGAGIVCPWTSALADDPVWYDLACASVRYLPGLVDELAEHGPADVGYRQVGALIQVDSAEEQQEVRQRLLARRAGAPEIGDVTALTGAEARGLFPPLREDRAAVSVAGACRVDGRRLADALARGAVARGAVITAGSAQLVCQRGRVAGVMVKGQVIEADAVVAATGAWTASFLEPAGIRVAVTPQRGQIVHLSVEPADTRRWPVVLPAGSSHYLLAFDGSRVVVGATRERGAGYDNRVTAGGLEEVLRHAFAAAPGLADARYLETRVGFRPVGPDARPLLGPVPGVDGLVVASGLGANGLTMGPYAGAIAARVALGQPTGIDLAPVDPLRSAEPAAAVS
jgi:D-amino-acid dehydrogenase